MWVVIQSGEKVWLTHLMAAEGQLYTRVRFIALFLRELWKCWDVRGPSPHLLPELLSLVIHA